MRLVKSDGAVYGRFGRGLAPCTVPFAAVSELDTPGEAVGFGFRVIKINVGGNFIVVYRQRRRRGMWNYRVARNTRFTFYWLVHSVFVLVALSCAR